VLPFWLFSFGVVIATIAAPRVLREYHYGRQ
jgi:hypothetical protein